MIRQVAPELLDALPADDARAIASRRDLVLVNALMSNARIVAGALGSALPEAPLRLAELGSGDGCFAARVLRRLGRGGTISLVDRQSPPDARAVRAMHAHGWEARPARADAFAWLRSQSPVLDAVFVNLFLHHFDDAEVAALLREASRVAPLFVACEPRRSGVALLGSRLLVLLGCNDVTRHDAVVSVRAGFAGQEISALWPRDAGWRLREQRRGLFSHAFVAQRR